MSQILENFSNLGQYSQIRKSVPKIGTTKDLVSMKHSIKIYQSVENGLKFPKISLSNMIAWHTPHFDQENSCIFSLLFEWFSIKIFSIQKILDTLLPT